MNKFKKGDKIRIKDEVSNATHSVQFPHFTEGMDRMKDKVFTIRGFTGVGCIEVQESGYSFHPDWVERVKRTPDFSIKNLSKDVSFDAFLDSLEPIKRELEDESFDDFLDGSFDDFMDWILGDTSTPESEVDSILEEAREILEGDRESDYGDPVANFNRISDIASSILNDTISPEQCVVVMMAVKLSREQYKHKRDNLVDLVAYTEIYNRIKEQNN